jgi:hypothetical protein
MLHIDEDKVAVRNIDTDIWFIHDYHHTQYAAYYFNLHSFDQMMQLPAGAYVPIDLEIDHDYIIVCLQNIRLLHDNTIADPIFTDIDAIFDSLPPLNAPIPDLLYNTNNDKLIICSDGGVRHNIGSYGIAVGTEDGILGTYGHKIEPTYGELTSYRTESIGMFQAFRYAKTIIDQRILHERWLQNEISLGFLWELYSKNKQSTGLCQADSPIKFYRILLSIYYFFLIIERLLK